MKYVLAGLAVVAAVAALVYRPPQLNLTPAPVPNATSTAEPALSARVPRPLPVVNRIVVYVAGEVVNPGVYTLAAGSRANDAVVKAGGLRPDADRVAVNLAARLTDGDEIAVAKIGAQPAARRHRSALPRRRSAAGSRPSGRRSRKTEIAPAPAGLDLNTATASDLERVPGVGPALAERIVAYRLANGPFASIDEIGDIAGVTQRAQDSLAAYTVVR